MNRPAELPDDVVADLLTASVLPAARAREAERVARIATEAARAFRALAGVRRGVAVFGSAREPPVARWGDLARQVCRGLAEAGFTVITGGGPGLMAAANESAQRAGAVSVGLTIHLPAEEAVNEFLTLNVPFHYFFLRKLAFVKYSCAFVILPGGYGTLDELFEALNLRRTHRLDPFPVILIGSAFWSGLFAWLRAAAVEAGTLSASDLRGVTITDDAREVVREIRECHATLCRRLGIEP